MTDIVSEIIDVLKIYGDETGLPIIPYADWIKIRSTYEREHLQQAFADLIIDNNIPFPFKEVSEEELKSTFFRLRKHCPDLHYPITVNEKHDFKYKYVDNPLGVIKKTSHLYNNLSNQFQQENRLNCGSVWDKSPVEMWTTKKYLKGLRWQFWNDKFLTKVGINAAEYRAAFQTASYTCAQFKPEIAKFCYAKTNAKTVLDLSCGWGDRLAGFFGSPNAEVYIGCDPNPAVYVAYKKQCIAYESYLGVEAKITEYDNYFESQGTKLVRIYNLPAEDVDWTQYHNYFDVMMTSPPYFALEKYDDKSETNSGQSWIRYPNFEKWRDEFLYPLIDAIIPTINETGFLMLNIVEPKTGGRKTKSHMLCDDMIEYIDPKLKYQGKLGMEIVARPDNIVNAVKSNTTTIEPIFVFSKGVFKTPTVDDFFV